jgi:tRNA(Ile)-lysidine synthase
MRVENADPSKIFVNKIEEIFSNKKLPKKIVVAVSGGSDSLALTLLLKDFCAEKNIKLFAVTIDHKMRKSSSREALSLSKILAKEKILHQILTLNSKEKPNSNIEAKLRNARYEMLHDFCVQNKIEYLFLGHQLDDVAENFLIRLFRGSGLDGLSAIAEISQFKKIKLVRPILNFEKDVLKDFLRRKKIKWFEDESNLDEKFLRNKIRNFLGEFEEKNAIQNRIKNAAAEISQMRDFVDDVLLREAKKILHFQANGSFLINQKKLQKIPHKIALKILAFTLMEVGGKIYKPRLEQLQSFYQYLIAEKKIKPRNFYGCIAKQKDEKHLIIEREKAAENFKNIVKFDEEFFLIDGRFLTKNPDDLSYCKFHFRTILGKLF